MMSTSENDSCTDNLVSQATLTKPGVEVQVPIENIVCIDKQGTMIKGVKAQST